MWPGRGRNRIAGVEDAGPRQLARGDRVAQRERHAVAVAEVAHGGEAGRERLARVDRGFIGMSGNAQGHVLQLAFDAGLVGGEVHVAVDQTGQHEAIAQVDDAGVGRCALEGGDGKVAITHRDDAAVVDQHGAGAAWRVAGTVQQRARLDQGPASTRRFGSGGRSCGGQHQGEGKGTRAETGATDHLRLG
jgi:hypothetical protein